MRRVAINTPPATEPVTTAELKLFLRIASTDTTEDTLLAEFIKAARIMAEKITKRTIPTTVKTLWLDRFPGDPLGWWDGEREGPIYGNGCKSEIEIPEPPFASITHIKTYDDQDVASTFASSNYYASSPDENQCGRIVLRSGGVWPVALRVADSIEIKYTAGYSSVPESLKVAIKMMAGYLYQNRGDCDAESCAESCGAMKILTPYIIARVRL